MWPSRGDDLSAKERLEQDIAAKLQESKDLFEKAARLNEDADNADTQEEEKRLRGEAAQAEEDSKTKIRQANRLQKGYFQGGATGAGIGAGVAGGLGMLTGSLVGGVTGIPTTALGILLGAGVGAVHGPWVQLVDETLREEEDEKTNQ